MSPRAEAGRREADRILRDSDAILTGDHFVYVTGEHGDGWIDKDAIFPHTERISRLGELLAESVAGREIDIVCGPATGGLVVSQWTARHLDVRSVFCDHGKEQGYHPATAAPGPLRPPFVLRRGYDRLVNGRRVLVLDDVVNTGESVAETAQAVRGAGGAVVAVAAICTRGNATAGDVGCRTSSISRRSTSRHGPPTSAGCVATASRSTRDTPTAPTSSPHGADELPILGWPG